MEHALQYTGRPGSNGIFTRKGDFIATVEDESIREFIIDLLNGNRQEPVNEEVLALGELCDANGITADKLEEFAKLAKVQENNADHFAIIKSIFTDLLSENIPDNAVDMINTGITHFDNIHLPVSKMKVAGKSKPIATERTINITIKNTGEISIQHS